MLYTHEQLVDILAKVMSYGANHFDDEWRKEGTSFSVAMEAVSMCVACWLAQHTNDGADGVEWEVVHKDLLESSWGDKLDKFKAIAERLIAEYGGVKSGWAEHTLDSLDKYNQVYSLILRGFTPQDLSAGRVRRVKVRVDNLLSLQYWLDVNSIARVLAVDKLPYSEAYCGFKDETDFIVIGDLTLCADSARQSWLERRLEGKP